MTDPITIAEAQGFELLKLQPPAARDALAERLQKAERGRMNAHAWGKRRRDERDEARAKLARVIEEVPKSSEIDEWQVSDWRQALLNIRAIIEGEV